MREGDAEFEAALERFLQSEPEPQDGDLLAATMQQDPESSQWVRQLLVMDDLLRQGSQPDGNAFVDALALRIRGIADDRFVERVEQATRPASPQRRTGLFIFASAAMAALVALLVWQWLPSPSSSEIVQLPKTQLEKPARPLVAPMPSSDTMVQIETGQQGYHLPSGVAVRVAGPASLRFVDDMFIDLQRGKVSADAGATTRGFTVQTAQARVVDLGTRFGVQAAEDQTTIAVFEGTVRVESRLTATMITLRAGEAMRVGEQGSMQRLTGIATGEQWQDWSLQSGSAIASVATTGKADAFCRLVPQGFKAGALAYASAPLRWEATGDMPFPKNLSGSDYIQAPQHAARDEDWHMTVKVRKPTTLYVLNSKSAPPPSWLLKDFAITGHQVAATELVNPTKGKPGRVQMKAVFDVWKRVIRQPGTILLGPPARQKDGKPTAMYGVAAQLLH